MADALSFSECVVVSGGFLKHKVSIPKDSVRILAGRSFLHCTTVPKHMCKLLAPSASEGFKWSRKNSQRPLSKTNIFEQLTKLRSDKLASLLEENQPQTLGVFEGMPYKRIRISEATKKDIPTAIDIDAPTIGPVAGIRMKVLMSWKKTPPLFIELVHANVVYLKDVCEFQLKSNLVKRTRQPKKLRAQRPLKKEEAPA